MLLSILFARPPCRVSASGNVGAAADGPDRPRVPVGAGREQPAEAERCRRPHEGRPRG